MKKQLTRLALVGAAAAGILLSVVPAAQAAAPNATKAAAIEAAADSCPDGDCTPTRLLNYGFQAQENGYYCGPAATRAALSARGFWYSQNDLAGRLGTTPDGTASVYNVTAVLESIERNGWYESKFIGGSMATQAQIDLLERDIRVDIRNGFPIVANIVGTATATDGSSRSYNGGHYLTVVGYRNSGYTAVIFDPARGEQYDMNVPNLAHWIAGRGYSA